MPYDFTHVALKKQQTSKGRKQKWRQMKKQALNCREETDGCGVEVSGGRSVRDDGDEGVPLS